MAGPRRRPRGPAPAPRRVEIRVAETEHAELRAAASRPGRGVSVARFVADAALAAARDQPTPSPRSAPSRLALAEVVDAVTAVNRVGNNLNQLAREKNVTGLRPVGSLDAERAALDALARLAVAAERATGGAA